MEKLIKQNIFFGSSLDLKELTDKQVLKFLNDALGQGWNTSHTYFNAYGDSYNALHECAIHGYLKSAKLLLDNGLDPNIRSGNGNTAFTLLLSYVKDFEELIIFFETLKENGADLAAPGYDNESPIILYDRYNKVLHQPIVEYLIKHADFENSFLLNEILKSNNLCTFENLKKILQFDTIDLKKIDINNDSENYLSSIAFYTGGKDSKNIYEKISWLHNKIGFDLDSWHTYKDYDNGNKQYYVNALGLAIQNKNSNMYNWILKRKPEFLNDNFYINNQPYSLLEFSVHCDFRKSIIYSLRQMNEPELNNLNIGKLKQMCSEPRTSETLEKTYTAIVYNNMVNKFSKNIDHKTKKSNKI